MPTGTIVVTRTGTVVALIRTYRQEGYWNTGGDDGTVSDDDPRRDPIRMWLQVQSRKIQDALAQS
ncbi:hypothetical protein HUO13_08010 [Saccharopolyspora erythraea]|uniref:hypothetical protein n=1 Tax=Saccharopolyspora erythraea TaxID=1836 RepID=UPI001BA7A13D|nr:hypothetical protein [Saccharopolyspora erythraea]QUH00764.1 hypothetical protein HUO13_08010 [Saccharopolyspora erythraea]